MKPMTNGLSEYEVQSITIKETWHEVPVIKITKNKTGW